MLLRPRDTEVEVEVDASELVASLVPSASLTLLRFLRLLIDGESNELLLLPLLPLPRFLRRVEGDAATSAIG